MSAPPDTVIETTKVREVAGVLESRKQIEEAVDALLLAGFDRADIDLMASWDAVRQKLGDVYAPATELADIPRVPRRAFIARADAAGVFAVTLGLLTFIGATAAALGVVASGGALALAAAAAIAGGATAGSAGALLFHRFLSRDEANELETQLAAGGLVLWARVRSPEREDKAQQILLDHGARAVRVHEIKLEKRLEDIPLSSLLIEPQAFQSADTD
jgi:hypothetical protein